MYLFGFVSIFIPIFGSELLNKLEENDGSIVNRYPNPIPVNKIPIKEVKIVVNFIFSFYMNWFLLVLET